MNEYQFAKLTDNMANSRKDTSKQLIKSIIVRHTCNQALKKINELITSEQEELIREIVVARCQKSKWLPEWFRGSTNKEQIRLELDKNDLLSNGRWFLIRFKWIHIRKRINHMIHCASFNGEKMIKIFNEDWTQINDILKTNIQASN